MPLCGKYVLVNDFKEELGMNQFVCRFFIKFTQPKACSRFIGAMCQQLPE